MIAKREYPSLIGVRVCQLETIKNNIAWKIEYSIWAAPMDSTRSRTGFSMSCTNVGNQRKIKVRKSNTLKQISAGATTDTPTFLLTVADSVLKSIRVIEML